MEGIHEALAWVAIVLFVLHVAGALRHQFLLQDPVIRRMAPGGSVAVAIAAAGRHGRALLRGGLVHFSKYLVPAMARRLRRRMRRRAARQRRSGGARAEHRPR